MTSLPAALDQTAHGAAGIAMIAMILVGLTPTIISLVQYIVVCLTSMGGPPRSRPHYPRVAFILPAWNEADVIALTIETLLEQDYPPDRIRIYAVDDASTDETPRILEAKAREYPGVVFNIRREEGGQGKAHTLNQGLRQVLADPWAEAIMIMDADILFEPEALSTMTAWLADPRVGAVTAYVKEGSCAGNYITRSIAFEYVTAQAISRRAQNVLGTMACLAGGAQLHSRANIEAMGGLIDTSTLAEDTYTTFQTQLGGRWAVFEPRAVVWAEEPNSLKGLWGQRLRWARGNLQLTGVFRRVWFRPRRAAGLGGVLFGALWFTVLLMPFFSILSAVGTIGLFLLDPAAAAEWFRLACAVTLSAYVFQTLVALYFDADTARSSWLEGILFPGLIALVLIVIGLLAESISFPAPLLLLCYSWGALSLLGGWLLFGLERLGVRGNARTVLLAMIGYGPIIAVVTIAALLAELRGADDRWIKTVKVGRVRMPAKDFHTGAIKP